MATLKCPTCGAILTVDSTFPIDFRCPKCKGVVRNPPGTSPGAVPMRVIPLEVEARGDLCGSIIAIGCSAAVFGLGMGYAVAMAWTRGINVRDIFQLTVVAIVALIIGTFALTQVRGRPTASSPGATWDARPSSSTIDYQTPAPRGSRHGTAGRIGSIVAAFIAGMLVTIGLLILIVWSICGGAFR